MCFRSSTRIITALIYDIVRPYGYGDRRQLLTVIMIICSFSFLPYIANFINPLWFTQRTHYTGNMTPLCFLRYPSPCHVPLPYPTFLHLLIYFIIVPYPNIIKDLVSLSTVLEHFYSLTLILVWIIMIAFLHFSFTLLYSFFSTMLWSCLSYQPSTILFCFLSSIFIWSIMIAFLYFLVFNLLYNSFSNCNWSR